MHERNVMLRTAVVSMGVWLGVSCLQVSFREPLRSWKIEHRLKPHAYRYDTDSNQG